ncbi:hypothetical protein V2W45_1465629 [Cenococcum geophilum]
MRAVRDYWLKLPSLSLNSSIEWINKIILASLSPDIFKAAIVEFLGYNAEFGLALLRDFSINNAVNSGLDIVRRLSVYINLNSRKILIVVDSSSIRRALGLFCPYF